MNFLISFVLITIKIVFCLSSYLPSVMYTLYQHNVQNYKFTQNFESMHLLKSYKTNRKTFSVVECLSLSLKNSSIKAITYEVNNDSMIDCKLYSPSVIEFSDLITTKNAVKLYLNKDITILSTTSIIIQFTSTESTVPFSSTTIAATTTSISKTSIFLNKIEFTYYSNIIYLIISVSLGF